MKMGAKSLKFKYLQEIYYLNFEPATFYMENVAFVTRSEVGYPSL